MATLKQKKVAHQIAHNLKEGVIQTDKEILISSGYTPISAHASANILIHSKGVSEELQKLGFNLDTADRTILTLTKKGKAETRIRASQEMYKRLGGYAPLQTESKNLNLNVEATASDIQLDELAKEVALKLKEKKTQ